MRAAAEGTENKAIARSLGSDANTVGKWRRRFARHRVAGLYDEPRSGAPRRIEDDAIAEIVRLTLETTPPDATPWSLRSMATAVGHAPSTGHRLWKAFCLQPHRSDTFKQALDRPAVCRKEPAPDLIRGAGHCWSLHSADERSQIQAPERAQPVLPMRPGQGERRSHDDTRHGTVSLFAALETATGKIVGRCFAPQVARIPRLPQHGRGPCLRGP